MSSTNESVVQWEKALPVMRRGLKVSPELRNGFATTVAIGLIVAVGRIAVPMALQRIIDSGIEVSGDSVSVDLPSVFRIAAVTAVVVLASALLGIVAERRLVRATEVTLWGLRTRAFAHVHRLSLADHVETDDGTFLTRVTSDVQAVARFAQWGLMAWIVGPTIVTVLLIAMAFYSWPLALLTVVVFMPVVPGLIGLQRLQLGAHDARRQATANMIIETDETITGATTIRASEIRDRMHGRVASAVQRHYDASIRRNKFMSVASSIGDMFGSTALAIVFAVGVWQREWLGLSGGGLVAILFLITLLTDPFGEIGETTDDTQSAIAGWRRILDLLDVPIDVVEPSDGVALETGALDISADRVNFAYRGGPDVLNDVSIEIPAGTNVAVVGETGSGKTTFAKLLCRLADPSTGVVRLGGVALDTVAPESRLTAVRMVPQDGFLFEGSLRENIELGAPDATRGDIDTAVDALGLRVWVDELAEGLETHVGIRGAGLSVGERQLVALIRAAIADPGLLILDEATSSVDPETDQTLSRTIAELSRGRTVVSIAHRLSTAEAADLILVFDAGRIVESGSHDDLVAAGGRYADLHTAWIGNTRR